MNKSIIPITILLLLLSCNKKETSIGPINKGESETVLLYSKFIDPPAEYRSFPFYSVNDLLEPEELKRQVQAFKDAGFGGFYFHSRIGLLTDYLSDDWWNAVDVAVETALENGLQVYFYDEDRWPSGYAGGLIPAMNADYGAKSLARLHTDTPLPAGSEVLRTNGEYVYISHTAQAGDAKFSGTNFVDLMNPEVVKAFMDVTHKQYINRYGNRLPYSFAIFSDEPHIHARYFDKDTRHQGIVSWSPTVRERFQEMFGYDVMDKIHLLFEEQEDWREVRLQFQQAVARQFEESFSAQIGRYSGDNNIRFTGHYLGEDGLDKVRERIGNSMPHYRNMQIPGIDMLGMDMSNRLITARRLTSVANQYAIPRRMSELFGISGQNMNFEDRKRVANWHALNGINHLVPHLTLYSMKGQRKRDYPPTFSYHQPYWSYNKEIEDYMGRISYSANVGAYLPQVLMVSPLESEFIRGAGDGQFTGGVLNILEHLQMSNYDYDIGDEEILSDLAKIDGGKLIVGAMSYQMVILPDMTGIRSSTLRLLEQLLDAGGVVVSCGERFPSFVDGKPDEKRLNALRERVVPVQLDDFSNEMNNLMKPNLTVEGSNKDEIWSHVRKSGDGYLVMLANMSPFSDNRFKVRSDLLDINPVLWNPMDAKCYGLLPDTDGFFNIELPASSMVWITSGSLSDEAVITAAYSLPSVVETILTLDGQWAGNRLTANALTMDFAQYSTDGGKQWSQSEPVIGIHERLTRNGYNGRLDLRYVFEAGYVPDGINLVVEQPLIYESVSVNGNLLEFTDDNYFIDRQFISKSIQGLVKKGVNTIDLSLEYSAPQPLGKTPFETHGTEIESIYLTGDFAVRGNGHQVAWDSQRNQTGFMPERPVHVFTGFTIEKEQNLFQGDLSTEGYPFYAGSFELSRSFKLDTKDDAQSYFLRLPNHEAIVVLVEVNGQSFAPLTMQPYQVEITHALKSGENQLKLTMVNSLRNLLGPHHHPWKEMTRVGPSTFSGMGGFPNGRGNSNWYDLRLQRSDLSQWNDNYYIIPYGLLNSVEICVSRR